MPFSAEARVEINKLDSHIGVAAILDNKYFQFCKFTILGIMDRTFKVVGFIYSSVLLGYFASAHKVVIVLRECVS